MKKPVVTVLGILGFLSQCGAGTLPTSTVSLTVVELFTSQGCSSCPPADALLGELANRADVLALAYHVDYWDYLGWRDKFALPEAAARQQRYVSALGLSGGFTPQSIVNGHLSFVGSDRRRLLASIDKEHSNLAVNLGVSKDVLIIKLGEQTGELHYDIEVITYVPQANSVIGRGENAGHTLKEFNIVRSVRHLGAWNGRASVFSVPLATLPADASRVAVLLQRSGQGTIAGAASITLR